MNKWFKGMICLIAGLFFFETSVLTVQAKENETILPGIFIEEISMEGKTVEEAEEAVNAYVEELLTRQIALTMANGNEVLVTPADMGVSWNNKDVVKEAAAIGKEGNIVKRYKTAKDLQFENRIFPLIFDANKELIRQILSEQCAAYNVEAQNATLSREEEQFVVHQGQDGYKVDEEASVTLIYDYLTKDWDKKDGTITLPVIVDESRGSEEELLKVKDVLGTFSTSFRTSGSSRSANVRNGCELINGITLYPGEEFSTYETVSPFSAANGYYMAGSYMNGQVVDSLGGGICQVSTTLYNAVLLSELEVTERHNHSMIVSYVDPSADAAIAESSGKDFRFVNNTEAPIYIEGYTTEDKQIVFTIYGMETRESTHRVVYKSEVVSKTYPDTEVIYTDPALPVGEISVQSAHVGYKANLWKIVYENEQEVSREKINSSSYQMAPRSATVGVATADPNAYNEIMAAIATNSIDHVKNVAAALAAAAVPPPAEGVPPAGETVPAAPPAQQVPPAEIPAE